MLSNTCKNLDIPFSHTSKLFFSEFSASVTVGIPFEPPPRQISIFFPQDRNEERMRCYRKNRTNYALGILGENDWSYKINEKSISFYFKQDVDLSKIVTELHENGDSVTKVVAPRSVDDIDFLMAHPSKVIRPTLYRGKYRFRIELKRCYSNGVAITDIIHHMFGGDYMAIESDPVGDWRIPTLYISTHRAHYNNNNILYVADVDDALLTRIAINEYINRIEEVVLKDVLNEGSIAA